MDKNIVTLNVNLESAGGKSWISWMCDFTEEHGRTKNFDDPHEALKVWNEFFYSPVARQIAARVYAHIRPS